MTTPYRSTIAISSLARCVAKSRGLIVREGDFGSDVEGTKPIFFDAGKDGEKVKDALKKCREQLGDNVTILYDVNPDSIKKLAKGQGKEAGGPRDCFVGCDYYDWEA